VYADIASGYGIMGLVANVAPVFFPAGNFNISTGQGNVGGLRLVISPGLPAKTVVVAAQSLLTAPRRPARPSSCAPSSPPSAGCRSASSGPSSRRSPTAAPSES
jgi:hypothetical protein